MTLDDILAITSAIVEHLPAIMAEIQKIAGAFQAILDAIADILPAHAVKANLSAVDIDWVAIVTQILPLILKILASRKQPAIS